jgi:hypothetical protein
MIQLKPYLFLNRLVVTSRVGNIAYDEKFHRGVNIVRGRNSSGKSTIAHLLFYSLGGEFTKWTNAAAECHEVFAEVEINEATVTIKRTISNLLKQPMSIFWGGYDEARSSPLGWKVYPYSQGTNKDSFSTVLFSILEIPEVKSENDNRITMNQILRLIYIDQESPTHSLFKSEIFDEAVIREAVADLLLGAYDDSLYRDRFDLREAKQKFLHKKDQLAGMTTVLSSSGSETDLTKAKKEFDKAYKQLEKVQSDILKIREKASVILSDNSPLRIQQLQGYLNDIKVNINKLTSEIQNYEYDIVDSRQFIDVLEKRLTAINDSLLTGAVLGDLPLGYCPQCLGALHGDGQSNICFLCKQPIEEDAQKTKAKRLKQAIEQQIKESTKLIEEKNDKFQEMSNYLQQLIRELRTYQREIDEEEKQVRTTRDEKLDNLLVDKGAIENNIKFLNKQITWIQQLEILRKELVDLKVRIATLNQSISAKESQQFQNKRNAIETITRTTLYFLRNDLNYQPEFKSDSNVQVNFASDNIALNGQNNFSASSNVYFKNAVRFAIFFSSLELEYFRFPRLSFATIWKIKECSPNGRKIFSV